MKLNNGQIAVAHDALTALCNHGNRMPVEGLCRAHANQAAVEAAFVLYEGVRTTLVKEHGEKELNEDKEETGNIVLDGTSPGWEAFAKVFEELIARESEVVIEPISFKDVKAGFARDPETGRKGPLEIGPKQLGALLDLGIVVDPDKKAPKKARTKKETK